MEKLSFELALKKLEESVEQLESGELELEESIKVFEEGIELSLFCRQELSQAEGKIQRLVKNLSGELELLDFEV
ncbi:MAG: exodeoxyribonuclease VII small subunit [Syntrophomonas sp.]|uniref:exodeoxyribonuclease VII small subunit n=1 Tax=Syntrophomonas sp. TaxID=2053627 RepID=UPI00260FA2A4|nr:exodeoxyribonuclease VII small subunit [Syntrophomonas sp.]MDD4627678.1 exodeoxyribonuclease VII small subunit [Syntrophomonas sp.]